MAARNVAWMLDHVGHLGEECLRWPFGKCRGYGQLKWEEKIRRAHRVMCELAHGQPPSPTHHAAHSCGNSECVNPNHLSWKTPSENQLDKKSQGRVSPNQGRHLLNKEAIMEIKALRGKVTQEALAKRFGVSRRTIGMAATGRTWQSWQSAK